MDKAKINATYYSSQQAQCTTKAFAINKQSNSDKIIEVLQLNFSEPGKNALSKSEEIILKERLGLKDEDKINKVNGKEIQIEQNGKLHWKKIQEVLEANFSSNRKAGQKA